MCLISFRYTGFLLNDLQPYYEVDYLLPRTIMAVMSVNSLKNVVYTEKFSPELAIGALYYYVKSGIHDNMKWKVIML